MYQARDSAAIWENIAVQYERRQKLCDCELKNLQHKRLTCEQDLEKAAHIQVFSIENVLNDIENGFEEFSVEMDHICNAYDKHNIDNEFQIMKAEVIDLYHCTQGAQHTDGERCIQNYKKILVSKQKYLELKIDELKRCKIEIDEMVKQSLVDIRKLIEATQQEEMQRATVINDLLALKLQTDNQL